MYILQVTGMTCGSCIRSITNALKTIDPGVLVTVDLAQQTVNVLSIKEISEITATVIDAGFPVTKSSNN